MSCQALNKQIRQPGHGLTNTDIEGDNMNWTKELPKEPGYYWILDHDEDGSASMSVVELVQMPDDKELIEEFMECEDKGEIEALIGKQIILSMGESYAEIVDELASEKLSWYGPLAQPEVPTE